MSVELAMLVYSTALLIVLVLIQATAGVMASGAQAHGRPARRSARTQTVPGPDQTGGRQSSRGPDDVRAASSWRAKASAHVSTPLTVLGAQVFFYSRVAHAALYLVGAPMVRPLVWAIGLAGTLMILAALLGL